MVLGEQNLSHLRRCEILEEDRTQRLRTGLISAAPPALGREDLGSGSAFLARKSEWETQEAGLKDQRYIEERRDTESTGRRVVWATRRGNSRKPRVTEDEP